MAKKTRSPKRQPDPSTDGDQVKRVIYLSRTAAERLLLHGSRRKLRPSQVIEGLILAHLPAYVVQDRSKGAPGEPG